MLPRAVGFAFLANLALVASCTSDATGPSAIPDVRSYVTPNALQFVDSRGAFLLKIPPLDTRYPIIDSVMAGKLADAFLKIVETVPGIWVFVETQHQSPLHASDMTRVPRVEFMDSPYEPVSEEVPDRIRREEGPYYVFRYLQKGSSAVTVTVSVYDTHLSIVDGQIVFPPVSGEEFYADGMRPGGYERPIGPEEAVIVAAKQTGARIDALPILARRGFQYGNQSAKWKLLLDRAVPVQGIQTGTHYSTNTVYVGMSTVDGNALKKDAMFVALSEQPTEELDFRIPLMLKVRKGFAVAYEEVMVSK